MSGLLKILFVIACFVPLAASSLAAQTRALKDLVFPQAVDRKFDLPDYTIGSKVPLTATISVKNTSPSTLVIDRARVSCGCMSVSQVPKSLSPGETKSLELTIQPESEVYAATLKSEAKSLVVRYHQEGSERFQEQGLSVSWKNIHVLAADPPKLAFDRLRPGDPISQSISVQWTSPDVEGKSESIQVDSVGSSYGFLKLTHQGNKIQVAGVVPSGFVPMRNPVLRIQASTASGKLPPLTLPMVLALRPRSIIVSPSAITLFEKPKNATVEVKLRLLSSNKKPFEVKSMQLLNTDEDEIAECHYVTIDEEPAAKILRVTIPVSNLHTALLRIQTDRPVEQSVTIQVLYAYQQNGE